MNKTCTGSKEIKIYSYKETAKLYGLEIHKLNQKTKIKHSLYWSVSYDNLAKKDKINKFPGQFP
ncbi:hypothetical protein FLGSB24_36780 [Flavobacterium sp. GSB-24]|nr:hypothetical protein FLGSB24_36780 [Flavobacterium sp. GSB-24]